MIARSLASSVELALNRYPAVAILGPRQVGKTTLARFQLSGLNRPALYLDMERPSDRTRLSDPEYFLSGYKDHLVIIDEIQQKMELFPLLRALIDEQRTPGRFLLLGSASDLLISRSSESLAGRISYKELHPLCIEEVPADQMHKLWMHGGYPPAFLAPDEASAADWTDNFVRTHLERELGVSKLRSTPLELAQLLRVVASQHGQLLNYTQMSQIMQLSLPTLKNYLHFFEHAFLLRTLQPYFTNVQKRLVKSPKLYIRDTGILHNLRGISSQHDLEGDLLKGASWEGFCIQQIMALLNPSILPYFYRTAAGAELDLVLVKGNKPHAAFEFKYSNSPQLRKGNAEALKDLGNPPAFVITPGAQRERLRPALEQLSIAELPALLKEIGVHV